ncbi:NUDIX hydrolase [Streptomyces malaysiensis subsp. malaysiensis]|uniref:NUDIX hydrolase n=1 Tax=Streptomyces malaysiensis TaxID=92644 RepID=A0ABX6W702_STRMQ|nr:MULTISPECIES: NUDIX hydrolase [Streptomyces]QPI57265.1 NUDIX hydrolase [Streptomyces solisilvae]UHH18808.1 NUDIX hydrolase [Streptomyces sp. HNM0561]
MSTTNGQWYPPEWPERIRLLSTGELTPVTPRRAATVLLLREGPGGPDATDGQGAPQDTQDAQDGEHAPEKPRELGAAPESAQAPESPEGPPEGLRDTARGPGGPAVYMLRRRASMAFAGGAYAYPGGSVDPRDERMVTWAGPSRAQWAGRLGLDPSEATRAQAIVCAAVRETFEEAGVLLAGPTPHTVVADTTGDDWEADRAALVARDLSFAEFLDRRGLVLRSDLLGCWARWITPEFEPRRYDTWFFVAALPRGQRTRNASTEADRTVWIRPGDAADGYDQGELLMMPPTIATLRQLAAFGSVAEALAAAADQDMTPVLARARMENGELVLSWPGHDEFTKHIPGATGGPSA